MTQKQLRWIRYATTTLVVLAAAWLAWIPGPPNFAPALIILSTGSAWIFCIFYALLSRGAWRKTKIGRHLMILTGGLALLGTHSLAKRIWGEWDWGWLGDSDAHREFIYVVISWQLLNRCVLMVVAHIRGERLRRAELLNPERINGETYQEVTDRGEVAAASYDPDEPPLPPAAGERGLAARARLEDDQAKG